MPERFEIYIVYKWRYINTLPFLLLDSSNKIYQSSLSGTISTACATLITYYCDTLRLLYLNVDL